MLPKSLATALETFAQSSLVDLARSDPNAIVAGIDQLKAISSASGQEEIAKRAMLTWRHRLSDARLLGHGALLRSSPVWAHLFIHHRDGYLREASLDRLGGAARNVFEVMAIAYRLNDWVEPVRHKAEACARRVFPETDPEILLAAALILALRIESWSRWAEPPAILIETLERPDIRSRFASVFRNAESGPMSTILRGHLRRPLLDRDLVGLAQDAALPGVRRIALEALLQGKVRWATGRSRKWLDKSLGRFRMVAIFSERAIEQPRNPATLIARGLEDPSIVVRRAALDGLIRYRGDVRIDGSLLDRPAADRSPSIRERVDFLRRDFDRGGS